MKKYKIYKKDNYIVVTDNITSETFYGRAKDVMVDKNNTNRAAYRFFNILDLKEGIGLTIDQILKEDGSPYTSDEFDTFYRQNTGNFNGGGTAPVADLISTDPDNAIELGSDGKLLVIQPKQYKFLLSQSGGDDPQTATSGSLTQGVTYEIVAFETGDDFTPSGAPNNDVGTKWIANGVAPTWSNGSEIGWNNGAPVVVGEIGENTLGMITWSRVDVGIYRGDLVGIFDDVNNLFSIVSQNGDAAFYKGNIQYDGEPDYFILNTLDFTTVPNDDMLFRTSILIEKN